MEPMYYPPSQQVIPLRKIMAQPLSCPRCRITCPAYADVLCRDSAGSPTINQHREAYCLRCNVSFEAPL